jgi:hypothetical protein
VFCSWPGELRHEYGVFGRTGANQRVGVFDREVPFG